MFFSVHVRAARMYQDVPATPHTGARPIFCGGRARGPGRGGHGEDGEEEAPQGDPQGAAAAAAALRLFYLSAGTPTAIATGRAVEHHQHKPPLLLVLAARHTHAGRLSSSCRIAGAIVPTTSEGVPSYTVRYVDYREDDCGEVVKC